MQGKIYSKTSVYSEIAILRPPLKSQRGLFSKGALWRKVRKNNLDLANVILKRGVILILGSLHFRILLYSH